MYSYSETNIPPEFYIYAWLRENGTPYYIGKGIKKRAWHSCKKHRPPKNKFNIVIMEANLSELGAFALERRYISWYGRKNAGGGLLINNTDGGDGASGWKFSEDSKLKMSKLKQGDKNNRFGTKHSEESKQKTRNKLIGRVFSLDTKEKMRISKTGKLHEKVSCNFCDKLYSKGAGMAAHIRRFHMEVCT